VGPRRPHRAPPRGAPQVPANHAALKVLLPTAALRAILRRVDPRRPRIVTRICHFRGILRAHVSLGKAETGSYEGSSSDLGNYAPGDPPSSDTHPTGVSRSSDALGESYMPPSSEPTGQTGHREVGHSHTTDTASCIPSDFNSGTQSRHERESVTSGNAGTPQDSELPGPTSTYKSPSNEPTGQTSHTEVGHSHTTDAASCIPSDFNSGTQSRHERESVTSGNAGTPQDSEFPGPTSTYKSPSNEPTGQTSHTEVGHSHTTGAASCIPSDFNSGTQSRHERDSVTSGNAGIPQDSEFPGPTSTYKSPSNEPTGQTGTPPPAPTPAADTPPGSFAGASRTTVGPSAGAPPGTEEPAPKQQGAEKPLSEPSDASAPSSSRPAPSGGNPLTGGVKLNNETTGKGTGEKYEESTGLAANGGDFDASRPGAGREADRLLDEQGIHRAHGGTTTLEDERAKKEAHKFGHPRFNAGGSQGSDHREHEKLTTKIKEKLHLGHRQ